MQYSLSFGEPNFLVEIHRRLAATYGPQPETFRLDPVSQLVRSILGARTRDEVSTRVFVRLLNQVFPWQRLAAMPATNVELLVREVTWPERKATFLPKALQAIVGRRGSLDLDFLRDWDVERALSWLEALPGVGPKTSASVLNFSRLHRRALVVDTHHQRVAARSGLIPAKSSLRKTSTLLARRVPASWTPDDVEIHHVLMKRLGQDFCRRSDPRCGPCPLLTICPTGGADESDPIG